MSGKLTVQPAGLVVADVGSTVVISCSSDKQLEPMQLQWFRPFTSSSYSIGDILAHNATVAHYGEGRIGSKWTADTELRLVISPAAKRDSGTYWCLLSERQSISVSLIVIDSARLHQNTSGWHLFLCVCRGVQRHPR